MLSPAVTEYLAGIIPQLAARAHASCKMIPAEDIEQGMWEAALARADKIDTLLKEGRTWNIGRILWRSASTQIRGEDRYQRARRALARGYAVEDEAFYSTGLIAVLLPLYLDGGVSSEPPKGRQVNTHVSSSEESGEYLAMMLDIDTAMRRIPAYHRTILERYYTYPQGSGGWTHEEIASALGITPTAARKRVSRALRAMQEVLGGASPWPRSGEAQERGRPLYRAAVDAGSGRA